MKWISVSSVLCVACLSSAPTPAGATQIISFPAMLQGSAALIDGVATAGTETYDSTVGPRRVVTMTSVAARIGSSPGASVTLKLLGGSIPSVGTLVTDHVPNIAVGYRYLLLLYSGNWFSSPVAPLQAYLVTTVLGQEVVIDPTGHAVLGFEEAGAILSDVLILDMNKDIATPFAAPFQIPGLVAGDLAGALDANGFVAALQAFMSARSLSMAGSFVTNPYNFGAVEPDTLAGGEDPSCNDSCSDQTYHSPNGEAP